MIERPDAARRALEVRRDHAVRDLEELAQQVEDGEIDQETADRLGIDYRAELDKAEAALADLPAAKAVTPPKKKPAAKASPSQPGKGGDDAPTPPRFPLKGLIGLGAAAVALTVVIVLIATSGDDEPQMPAAAGATSAPGNGATLDPGDPLTELEAAIAANPQVNSMRLALAGELFDRGDYLPAMEHYLAVLDNSPTLAEESVSLARVGWMAYVTGQPNTARDYLHAAVQMDPAYGEAKLFYGVVLLYGIGDAEAALPVLEEVLQLPDLPESLRPDVENMIAEARAGGPQG